MKYLIITTAILAIVSCSQPKEAQTGSDNIAELINNQRYKFTARTVLPSGGRVVQLTTTYDLQVTKDSVISFLPYFGRAYTAPIGNTNAGIQFTSTNFSYTKEDKKKGGWLITIKPNDFQDIQQMFLTVSSGGSASLQVTSNSRQAISYNGIIEKK
jgi:hypothetical protein